MGVSKLSENRTYLNRIKNIIGYNEIQKVSADRINYCKNLGLCDEDIELFLRYGLGGLDFYIWFYTPFDERWEEWVCEQRKVYQYLKESAERDNLLLKYVPPDNEGYNFEFYPDKSGLVPWAICDCGTVFYWRVTPEKFTVVVYGESDKYYEYDMTISEFLYRLITKEIPYIYDYLPEDIFSDGVKYYWR